MILALSATLYTYTVEEVLYNFECILLKEFLIIVRQLTTPKLLYFYHVWYK